MVTGDILVKRRNATDTADIALGEITQVAFRYCAPFKDCRAEINDTFVDYANFINITMPMYNLIEYSDNYSNTSGSLWGFKKDDVTNNANVGNDDNAPSFKYNASGIGDTENNGTKMGVKIAVPLKCLSNFWRSLEMTLINCKFELSLKWIEHCVLSTANAINVTSGITNAKLYVPTVTLSAEDNEKLVKKLIEGFKRLVYWNKCKVIDNTVVGIPVANTEKHIRELLDSSYQGVKRLFVLGYDNAASDDQDSVNSSQKYFLPRVKIENYNIEINGRNFYYQPMNDLIKQYDKVRKVSARQGDDYTTGCLLDFAYFEKNTD